jgi:tetratricopeptide (TPR) repeat protein
MFDSKVLDELFLLAAAIKPLVARFCKLDAALRLGPRPRHSGRRGHHTQPAGGQRHRHCGVSVSAPGWEVQVAARNDAVSCVAATCGPAALLPLPNLRPAAAPHSAQVAALLATEPPAAKEPEAAPSADEDDIFEDAKEALHGDADPLYEKRLEAIKAGAKMRPDGWLHPAAFHANKKRAKKEAQRAKKAQVAATAALPAEETAEVAALLAEAVPDPVLEDETALCGSPEVQSTMSGFNPRTIFEKAAAIGAARSAATLLPPEVLEPQSDEEPDTWEHHQHEGDRLQARGIYDEASRRYTLALDAYYAAAPDGYDGRGAWRGHDLPHLRELIGKRLVAMEWCEHRGDFYMKNARYSSAAECYRTAISAFDARDRPRPPALSRKIEEVAPLAKAEDEYKAQCDFEDYGHHSLEDEEEALPDAWAAPAEVDCPSTCPGFDKDWQGHAEAWCPKYLAAAGFPGYDGHPARLAPA